MSVEMQIKKIAAQSFDNAVRNSRMLGKNIILYGGQFLNPRQERVATRFLLKNDAFIKTAQELNEKTNKIIAILPNSKHSPAVQMRILEGPQNPFDSYFAKDKGGGFICGFVDDRQWATNNEDFVQNFISLVKNYIKGH